VLRGTDHHPAAAPTSEEDAFEPVAKFARFFHEHGGPVEFFRGDRRLASGGFAVRRYAFVGGGTRDRAFTCSAPTRVLDVTASKELTRERTDVGIGEGERSPHQHTRRACAAFSKQRGVFVPVGSQRKDAW